MLSPLFDRPIAQTAPVPKAASLPGRIYQNLAAHDWLVAGYFVVLFFALTFGNGEGKADCYRMLFMDVAILGVGFVFVCQMVARSCFSSGLRLLESILSAS